MSDVARPAKVSPASILGAPRRPVTRYRPWVIALLAGGVLLLVGLGFMIGFSGGRGRPVAAEAPAPEAAPGPPDLDARLPASYDDPLALRPAAEAAPDAVAAPALAEPAGPSAEETQQEQEQLAARASGPFFGGAPSARGLSPSAPPTPGPPGLGPMAQEPDAGTPKETFVARAGFGQHVAPHLPAAPLSRLEIKAGTIISAALITGLNSDLPGPVVAQVTEPVFDHLTGSRVLIAQGARLIGRYDSQVSHGQDRVLVVWTRIVFPDGRSLNIGAMTGADTAGASGLADQVDAHVPVLARAVGLSTLISIGGAAAQNSLARGSDNLVLQDGAGGLAASASETGQRIVERDLQRAPTLRVRPGWPLRLIVDKDLVFLP